MAPHTVSSPENNKLFESSLATLLWARKVRIAGLCFESFTFLETKKRTIVVTIVVTITVYFGVSGCTPVTTRGSASL